MPNKFELFQDITSRGNDFQDSAWDKQRATFDSLEQGLDLSGINSQDFATVFLADSGKIIFKQSILSDSLAGRTASIGIWARFPVIGSIRFTIADNVDEPLATNTVTTIRNSLDLFRVTHTFSTGYTPNEFRFLFEMLNPNSGDVLSLWRAHAFFNTEDDIQIEPEFNYVRSDEKIQDMHVTRVGNRFTHKFGDRFRVKFGQKFADSQTASTVNSWWKDNTELFWVADCGLEVRSVHITNKNLPIGQFVLPSDTLHRGSIELETY